VNLRIVIAGPAGSRGRAASRSRLRPLPGWPSHPPPWGERESASLFWIRWPPMPVKEESDGCQTERAILSLARPERRTAIRRLRPVSPCSLGERRSLRRSSGAFDVRPGIALAW